MSQQFNVRDRRAKRRYFVDNMLLRGGWGKAIGPYGIAVYNAIALHADADHQSAYPSHELIADLTGMSRPTVIKSIKKLESYNIVAVDKEDGRVSTYYLIDCDDWIPVNEVDTSEGVKEIDTPVNEVDTLPVNEVDTNKTHPSNKTQSNNTADAAPAASGIQEEDSPKKRTRRRSKTDELKVQLVEHFVQATQLPEPPLDNDKQKRAAGRLWFTPLLKIARVCDNDVERTKKLVDWTISEMDRGGLTISSPNSIVKMALGEQARRKRESNGKADSRTRRNGSRTPPRERDLSPGFVVSYGEL